MEFNWLGIILATLVPTIIGFIYYHPALFGKAWMASIGMTEEKQKEGNMGMIFGISIVMSLLMTFFLTGFNNGLGQEGEFDTFGHGAAHGVIVSLFLVIPVLMSGGLFEQKGFKNILINGLYWLITFAIMGGIVDYFHHWPNS